MDSEPGSGSGPAKATDLQMLCRLMFEGSPLPMVAVAGTQHVVRYVNPAACRLAGKSKDKLIGIPIAEIVPEDGLLSILDRVYRTGEAGTHTEPERAETRTVYWSYAIWPILGADERPAGVMIQVTETARFHRQATAMNQELMMTAVHQHELTDVAEKLNAQLQLEMADRKRMEQALMNSEKLAATARLASTMAHEINNPLGAITNLIFLLAPLQSSPEAQAYIATLDVQVRGLARISTQMLKLHRDSNRPTKFELSEVLREISDFYRPQAERQGVVVHERIETEGSIEGFRGEIAQVVTNLLLNALEATSVGGNVSFHLYPAPPWLCEVHGTCGYCLSIADTGKGIDPENYARLFEPFFTTKGDKGTGLGLWLCKGIISRVEGSIRVWSSRRPNRSGTCFSVFLPAEEAIFTPLRRRYEAEEPGCQTKE
jgi:two-component system NtrC family sensor kinase